MSNEDSAKLFVKGLQERLGNKDSVDAPTEWTPDADPTGIHVVEHTNITELDERTQDRMLALMETMRLKKQDDLLLTDGETVNAYDTVRVRRQAITG